MSKTKNAFKDTLNLPKTSFPMKANLSQNEPLRLKKWKSLDIYDYLKNQCKDLPNFTFHDGPPYANGSIHIGHLLNKVLKDLVVRSQMLLGNRCDYIPGWDCHGLPIEHKVLSELSDEKKTKLASLTPDQERLAIRNECKKYAEKFIKLQSEQMKRLLTVADYDNPYLTFQPEYESKVLDVFAKMVDEGIVFRQLKPVHWSIANQTALAEAELEYMDKTSDSIAVKFNIEDHPFSHNGPVYAVIWTTTPWTLPANLAVAFGGAINYSMVRINGDACIMASERVDFIKDYVSDATIIEPIDINQLRGHFVTHPFIDRKGPILEAGFVTTEDGSGLVHIAPGHGTDDYILGQANGLDTYCPVQADGTYDDTVPDWLNGQSIWSANKIIVDHLQSNHSLVFHDTFVHSYPHDWRSKTPVIFRSTDQWFIGVDHSLQSNQQTLRKMALDHIQSNIDFYPDSGKARLYGMLETRPDWCISRQRAWGLPIPAFQDANGAILLTGESVRAISKIVQTDGSDAWFRKTAQELLINYDISNDSQAPQDFDISSAEKLNDIFDVWFESGSSWHAVIETRQGQDISDLYLEGSDQHRGWFHLSLLPSLAVNKRAPFKSILTHGFIVDKDGRKMSKSQGNALTVDELLKNYGAEVTRWWVSSLSYDGDIKVDLSFFSEAGDLYRKIRNTLRFIVSNLNDFEHNHDLNHIQEYLTAIDPNSIDAYALSLTQTFQNTVTEHYKQYQFRDANQAIYQFCNDTLSSFYCSSVKDRLYCDAKDSDRRQRTQYTLRYILEVLVRSLSPILPHTCDEVLESLLGPDTNTTQGKSILRPIHLSSNSNWSLVMDTRKQVLKLLEDAKASGIENSLDAGVELPNSIAITDFSNDLDDIFGVSRVGFSEINEIKINNLQDQPCCERSWKRDETVCERSDGSILSERDFHAINQ